MMGTALMENNCNEWKRMVSYCDSWMSIVRRASCVMRRSSCTVCRAYLGHTDIK